MRLVVMGVSGCGKSTVGLHVAQACGARFVDGDDLHPVTNIDKMSQGVPLDDADRMPWLARIGDVLAAETGPMVIACSALKTAYRDLIRAKAGPVNFVHLQGALDVLERRMQARAGHFMPPELLNSQLAELELLGVDEDGIVIDINQPFDAVVRDAARHFRRVLNCAET